MAASCQTGNQSGTTRAEETNPSITIAAAHRPIPIRLGPGRPPGVRASSIGGHARTVRTPRARVTTSSSLSSHMQDGNLRYILPVWHISTWLNSEFIYIHIYLATTSRRIESTYCRTRLRRRLSSYHGS